MKKANRRKQALKRTRARLRRASLSVSGRASGKGGKRASSRSTSERGPVLDDGGRVLKGRKLDIPGTEEFYGKFYSWDSAGIYQQSQADLKRSKRKSTQKTLAQLLAGLEKERRAELLEFVDYFNAQSAAGRVAVRPRKGMKAFAARFGSHQPKGSKVLFVPRSMAKVQLTGKYPRIVTKRTVTTVFFLDFVTDEWVEELEQIEDPTEQREPIEEEVKKFVLRLPKRAVFSVTLATGDYAKGSTMDQESLVEFLVDLLMRFIKSKGTDELKDFAVAVNAIVTKPKPKKRKKSKKSKKAKKRR